MAVSPNILVILGPTASGKSALAMAVAQRVGGEILSVDSMQVYRGMDIGTAKPTAAERALVPHHLIDVVDPTENFTVARFVSQADEIFADAARRNVPIIATGGTPLYYKSLFHGLFDGPPANDAFRLRLSAEPLDELHAQLKNIDPAAATRIHANDRKRITRALEVFHLTGQPISSFQTEWANDSHRHVAVWFGLHWEKEAINRRINSRTKEMIDAGWLDEVKSLRDRFGSNWNNSALATGYGDLLAHLRGEISLADAIEQIKISTRQLARRQMKWFRRFPNVHWLAGEKSLGELTDGVLSRWNLRTADNGTTRERKCPSS